MFFDKNAGMALCHPTSCGFEEVTKETFRSSFKFPLSVFFALEAFVDCQQGWIILKALSVVDCFLSIVFLHIFKPTRNQHTNHIGGMLFL